MKDNIKTAEEILNKWHKPLNKIGDIASIQLTEAMKEYAEQFIDLASEESVSHYLHEETENKVKEAILDLKQLIK